MPGQNAVHPGLSDHVVLVTGGASGIGADIVRAFAGQGAKVAFLDVQDAAAQDLITELSAARHVPLYRHCDLTQPERITAATGDAAKALGPVSVLVNNAADDTRHSIADVTPDLWDRLLDVNLRSQFFAAQAVAPMMKALGGGAIVNLSSIAWKYGADVMPAYGAAKAGVVGLTYALARALGPDNIRVNAVEPGAVMTERQRKLWYPTQASVDAMVAKQILRQPLLGEDIARTVLFLASDEARMITRQTIVVDAGMS
jgi:D-xylose 1-dehydrogenase